MSGLEKNPEFRCSGSIRKRMLVAFLILVLLPTVAIIAGSLLMGIRSGKQLAISQLDSVAAIKEAGIKSWLDHMKYDLANTIAGENREEIGVRSQLYTSLKM